MPAQLHGGGRVLAAGVRGALRPGLRPPLHRHAARDPPRAGLAARGGLPRPGGRGHARWQHQHTVVNIYRDLLIVNDETPTQYLQISHRLCCCPGRVYSSGWRPPAAPSTAPPRWSPAAITAPPAPRSSSAASWATSSASPGWRCRGTTYSVSCHYCRILSSCGQKAYLDF